MPILCSIKEVSIKDIKDIVDINAEFTIKIDQLIDKLEQGIENIGERNRTAFYLARCFRTKGYSKEECKNKLIEWHSRLDPSLYKSTATEIERDVEYIIKSIYSKRFKEVVINPLFTANDVCNILEIKGVKKQKLFTAMLYHSKRYKDKNDKFHMSYDQLRERLGITTGDSHLKKMIGELVEQGIIEVISIGNNLDRKSNAYRLILKDFNIKGNCTLDCSACDVFCKKHLDYIFKLLLFDKTAFILGAEKAKSLKRMNYCSKGRIQNVQA